MSVIQLTPEHLQNKVVGLYALLDYDAMEFIDALKNEPPAVLNMLLEVLEHENSSHNQRTKELNAMGASVVRGALGCP